MAEYKLQDHAILKDYYRPIEGKTVKQVLANDLCNIYTIEFTDGSFVRLDPYIEKGDILKNLFLVRIAFSAGSGIVG